MEIFTFLVIGAISGLIAGQIMRGGGFGLLTNMGLGVVGALFGGLLFSLLGISAGGILGSIVTATVGAIAILYIGGILNKRKP
ncbi:MAG: GlsB/YeaQ/YmgE family stress response membrane protein [Pseudomonadota bacterium]